MLVREKMCFEADYLCPVQYQRGIRDNSNYKETFFYLWECLYRLEVNKSVPSIEITHEKANLTLQPKE